MIDGSDPAAVVAFDVAFDVADAPFIGVVVVPDIGTVDEAVAVPTAGAG
jgi:hypothetical protein